ncbi:tRNA (guanine-N(7)-)-methyltransferase [Carnimonas sp. R-84981]|uniref:tRNA (guanine(46)-N(7))-methyltransferase TrmB n=1 Tax=Carnimonas bestiolae TaxID=3402172 RepID=UPI003EDBF889
MQANSSPIESSQRTVHSGLAQRVERALQHPWQRPVADHSREAFERAQQWRAPLSERALIIDAGCGVGLSTRRLAEQHPDAVVIGIDRSDARLTKDHGRLPDNALLVRADLVDFWRLALSAGWQPVQHYLLYPNPYPKPGLLKQRWQGHPVFPTILKLGGRLELRSNWRLYVEEFAQAIQLVTGTAPQVEAFVPTTPALTPFEEKYHHSGHSLWRLRVELLRQSE